MFRVLLYYDAFDKLLKMVSDMKKIGIDVASHQSPNQVLTQVIEFNADFVVLQTGQDASNAYLISSKLIYLAKAPTVILIKNAEQQLNPEDIIANNVSKVFSEPLDFNAFLAHMLEVKGFDPVEYFNKYLELDYKPKKLITPKRGKIDDKFKTRNYSKDYSSYLDDEEVDLKQTFNLDKLSEFKKNQKDISLDAPENEREQFMKALLSDDTEK